MGGKCPGTCCRGWLIPMDEEDLERFKKEKGRLGFELFLATGAYRRTKMNLGSGECRFHTGEGLCSLQLKKGHDFIPWACRSFPRFYRNYGDFEERYLDLSCIAAAKMFVENADSLNLTCGEDEPATRSCTTNDDRVFLEGLIRLRKEIIEETGSVFGKVTHMGRALDKVTVPISRLTDSLYKFACDLQDTYAHGGIMEDLPPLKDRLKAETDGVCTFPLPPDTLNEFVETAIRHFGQKKTGPALYGLLSDALSITGEHRHDPSGFADKAEGLCSKNAKLLPILGGYMSYYLYQYFLGIYETYSFRKVTTLGIIHMNMILLLAMTYAHDGRDLTEDDLAYIISIYNRKAFFNETIEDSMYDLFER